MKTIRISPKKTSYITGEVYWPQATFTPNSGKLEKKPLVSRQRQKNISLQDNPMPQNQDQTKTSFGLWQAQRHYPEG